MSELKDQRDSSPIFHKLLMLPMLSECSKSWSINFERNFNFKIKIIYLESKVVDVQIIIAIVPNNYFQFLFFKNFIRSNGPQLDEPLFGPSGVRPPAAHQQQPREIILREPGPDDFAALGGFHNRGASIQGDSIQYGGTMDLARKGAAWFREQSPPRGGLLRGIQTSNGQV